MCFVLFVSFTSSFQTICRSKKCRILKQIICENSICFRRDDVFCVLCIIPTIIGSWMRGIYPFLHLVSFQNCPNTTGGISTTEEMETIYSYQYQSRQIFKASITSEKQASCVTQCWKTSDGQTFPVHRNVLQQPVITSMQCFVVDFKEAQHDNKTPIVLQEISATGLNAVLDCIYSDTLILTKTTVFEVLAVAHMWCLENIVNSCGEYMVKHISTETCFTTLRISRKFAMPYVEKGSENFIRNHFVKLSKTEEFLNISCDLLCRFLQDDTLVGQELELFRAAMRWLSSGVGRSEFSTEVMRLINLKSIACDQLVDEVMNVDNLYNQQRMF